MTQQPFDVSKLERLNLTESQLNDMYRLLELPNMKIVLLFQLRTKETYLDTYRAQGSQGYGGEYLVQIVKVVV